MRRSTAARRIREDQIGEIELLYEVVNQDGVVAMAQRSLILIEQREA